MMCLMFRFGWMSRSAKHRSCTNRHCLVLISLFYAIAWSASPLSEQQVTMRSPTVRSKSVHNAPTGVDYSTYTSVFGGILRGEVPASVLKDTEDYLVFRDRTPRAPLHALVIPKRFVRDVTELGSDKIPMLIEMKDVALETIRDNFPDAAKTGDYILCFHIPPFTSVDHLHLHILAPASEMNWWWRNGKYRVGTPWTTGVDTVLERLNTGKHSVTRFPWSD